MSNENVKHEKSIDDYSPLEMWRIVLALKDLELIDKFAEKDPAVRSVVESLIHINENEELRAQAERRYEFLKEQEKR